MHRVLNIYLANSSTADQRRPARRRRTAGRMTAVSRRRRAA